MHLWFLTWEYDNVKKNSGITRRDFLNGALRGSAAVAAWSALSLNFSCFAENISSLPAGADLGDAYSICHALQSGASWDLPAASGELLDCIVIGGGPSGLITAWKLRRLGFDAVEVLEKDDPAGGFCRSDSHSGLTFTRAADYVSMPETDDLIEMYLDLGIVRTAGIGIEADNRFIVKSPKMRQFIDGKWYGDPWKDRLGIGLTRLPFSAKVIADLKAFRRDAKAWYFRRGNDGLWAFGTPDECSADRGIRSLDQITLAQYIAGKGWDPKVSEFLDTSVRAPYALPHDQISAWVALFELCADVWGGESDRKAGDLAYTGGLAFLTQGLAEKIGTERITTGAVVVNVVVDGSEVHVSYVRDGAVTTIRSKTVVYAAPRYMAPYVIPGLAAEGRNEASQFSYSPYIVANVLVSSTPPDLAWYNEIVEGTCFVGFTVADWHEFDDPASAPVSRPNVLTVYMPLNVNDKAALLSKSIDYYEELVLAELERVLPGVRETVTAFDLYRWGHAMVAPRPGFVFSSARIEAKKPLGPISFACTDVEGVPTFECAAAAGFRAAGRSPLGCNMFLCIHDHRKSRWA